MSRNNCVPKYGLHKATGQARVLFGGREMYLGPYDLLATRETYDRLVAEYLAAGCDTGLMTGIAGDDRFCVAELIDAFREHAESCYFKDEQPTKTIANVRIASRRLLGFRR